MVLVFKEVALVLMGILAFLYTVHVIYATARSFKCNLLMSLMCLSFILSLRDLTNYYTIIQLLSLTHCILAQFSTVNLIRSYYYKPNSNTYISCYIDYAFLLKKSLVMNTLHI